MELTPQRGAIPIQLDRPRILFFDTSATWQLFERYGIDFVSELYAANKVDEEIKLTLKSADALCFFLWVGLQAELKGKDESLTLEQVSEFIRPWSMRRIFMTLVLALTGATATPAEPGKGSAASPAAKPAAKKKAAKRSILKMRNGLRLER